MAGSLPPLRTIPTNCSYPAPPTPRHPFISAYSACRPPFIGPHATRQNIKSRPFLTDPSANLTAHDHGLEERRPPRDPGDAVRQEGDDLDDEADDGEDEAVRLERHHQRGDDHAQEEDREDDAVLLHHALNLRRGETKRGRCSGVGIIGVNAHAAGPCHPGHRSTEVSGAAAGAAHGTTTTRCHGTFQPHGSCSGS